MPYNHLFQRKRLIGELAREGIVDQRILSAIARVPRERFIAETLQRYAYTDRALPIGMGQTISQPLMVALMTQALQLSGQERVLEIGTGSGYQTAVLALLVDHVYSVERYPQLTEQATWRLEQMGLQNVSLAVRDGTLGWPEHAPYDRILVTAAAPEIPTQLLSQLTNDGILIVPVGSQQQQELQVVKNVAGEKHVRSLGKCVFVPLIGSAGWPRSENG
ncbi:protein-L-isoaspartate(D-aspartate) O-methyltransferase [Ktedonosporobacter rubrisoli]|uniref:Protein-L-isoaspartate O-methyltransferase n=1 Tax=Ktedonosporobacter rubrisoli TaxID=2509675 RepID=A0A4P6K2I4_KTERU|nr:protein-L-isoaspartate(D-aspartate) O-methyltransferase [Ktedonosporobacter rubrisoli]QBD82073.1 protein-L-isoaspartate(D-aspartate) O-methyltransferase [Ktedonosporobacter rubrisoli]